MSKKDKSKDKRPDREELRSTADFDIPVCGPGTQIGQFRIEREIGRGGMGVVYLAHDSKLDRQVAIKSIPPILADNTKVQSRFRREAKLLASLDHPDIATIYDIIEGDKGIGYLVLEYIPGDTLADCIARGPLPPKEVLSVSGQIASAFASAHEHGIVHRDLKPANIKITKEQRIKVLDFGIAKAVGSQASNAYTTVTEPGQLIGTPAYMSPEQARGKPSDERGDIWSFGCVLYEMLTGKPPFQGETASDTLADVLQSEPNWDALPQATPANVKLLIRRCLEKDPHQRLQHIGDAALEIRETLNLPAVVPPMTGASATATQPATLRRLIPWAVAVLILTAVAASLTTRVLFRSSPHPPLGTTKFSIPILSVKHLGEIKDRIVPLSLSPDGKQLVYASDAVDGKRQLYIRSMDDLEAKPVPDTENASNPCFSPNGQWLAFSTQEIASEYTLWKLKIDEDVPRASFAKGKVSLVGWSDNGAIFFSELDSNDDTRTLYRVPADGRSPEPVAKEVPEQHYSFPQILPGRKGIIFSPKHIELLLWETGRSTTLIENAQNAQYSPTGHLLFTRDTHLFAVSFDVDKLEITGPEVAVSKDISMHNGGFSIASNGTLAYTPASLELPSLVWIDRHGKAEQVAGAPPGHYEMPCVSPDETQLAVARGNQIWRHDLIRNVSTPLTAKRSDAFSPCWRLPNGEHVSFSSAGVKETSLDGDGKIVSLLPSDNKYRVPSSWSRDGRYLAYFETHGNSGTDDIWILPMGKDGNANEPTPFLNTVYDELAPKFHPSNDRYIAYICDQTGEYEVYVREFLWGNLSEGWVERISSEGGTEPCWSRDGSRLFYRSAKGMMEVVIDFEPDGAIRVGKSQFLFEDNLYERFRGLTNYDVTSDERFLMVKGSPPSQINVVVNWSEELKRLAPTGKK